jgi:hypothetical protein
LFLFLLGANKMKYAINQLEAVRGYYDTMGEKPRIRFYANGKECAKALATEFSVSGVDKEYVAIAVAKRDRKESANTKSARLRRAIKNALADGTFDFDDCVEWVQEEFEFARPLALQYVKNNLRKVEHAG